MASENSARTKQAIGIDISKDTFDVKILIRRSDQKRHLVRGSHKFSNTAKGLTHFHDWALKKVENGVDLVFAMEATGVYHEQLAHFLHDNGYHVSVLLPNQVKAFARSLNEHSKTDSIDAGVIARMALERNLEAWQAKSSMQRQLRSLTRERQELLDQKTRLSNRMHAYEHSYHPNKPSMRRLRTQLKLIIKQIAQITIEIKAVCTEDEVLKEQIDVLTTIPQVGFLTAAVVLGETSMFTLFSSRSQVVKFAGMDIIERQSGTSVKGRGHLSKRGNSRLRKALFLPSLGMIRRDGVFNALYLRVFGRTKCKMKALVAVQRKLLVVMYALSKSGQRYDKDQHAMGVKIVGELTKNSPTVTLSA